MNCFVAEMLNGILMEKIANNILKSTRTVRWKQERNVSQSIAPACFQQFDNEQAKLKDLAPKGFNTNFPILFHHGKLLAMAMGKDPKEMGISFHRNG